MTKPCHLACERLYDIAAEGIRRGERKCFARPSDRNARCFLKHDNLRWIRVHRRDPAIKAVPAFCQIDARYPSRDFEGWPTVHSALLDALSSPYGNELWQGVTCNRNHNCCTNRPGRLFCAALIRRAQPWALILACLRGLIEAAKDAGDEAKESLFILMDAAAHPYTAEVPVRMVGEHLVNRCEPGSIPWKYGAVLVNASPIFGRDKSRKAGEALSCVRHLILHLAQHFPRAAATVGGDYVVLADESEVFAEKGKVTLAAQIALGPRAHSEFSTNSTSKAGESDV